MSRFRFRLWLVDEECYYGTNHDVFGRWFNITSYGEPVTGQEDCIDEPMYESEYVLEQCTGLKDCTGKYIYEGDVLKFNMGNSRPFQVVWSELDHGWMRETSAGSLCSIDTDHMIIIGNIHKPLENSGD